MISLNKDTSVGNHGSSSSSSSSSSRKKGSGHIGSNGAILKSGDIIYVHDANYEKQYLYHVDITAPQYQELNGEDVTNKGQPDIIIKDDSVLGSSNDTMVDPLLLKQPEP